MLGFPGKPGPSLLVYLPLLLTSLFAIIRVNTTITPITTITTATTLTLIIVLTIAIVGLSTGWGNRLSMRQA